MKVSIVGVGRVGSSLGLALVAGHTITELVLVGRNGVRSAAEALDLSHGAVLGRRIGVRAGGVAETAGSDVIVFTAGVPQIGFDRTNVVGGNYRLLLEQVPPLVDASPGAVLLVVTNPVDALTTLALGLTGLPPERVLGAGTLLDTMRLRDILSRKLDVLPLDVRAYVVGEHGDTQFAAYSSANVGGGDLGLSPTEARRVETEVREAGMSVFRGKGYTNQGIALACARIIDAIATDSHEIMPLSVLPTGLAGIDDVCLSIPVIVGAGGALRQVQMSLTQDESAALDGAAASVRRTVARALASVSDRLDEATTPAS